MDKLLEDYKRKLKTANELLQDAETPEQILRITTKIGMIRSFIVDIERAMADANTGDSGLHLQSVSNRRELLSNFANWYNSYYDFDFTIDDSDIDEFFKIAL